MRADGDHAPVPSDSWTVTPYKTCPRNHVVNSSLRCGLSSTSIKQVRKTSSGSSITCSRTPSSTTPSGGRIEVDLSVIHDRVELVVLDTGIGIGVRDRNHVFSRFFRTRHAAQRSIQGIGLGLSITKAIVDSHGGRIEVESEEGRGSTFRVRLPLYVPAEHDLPLDKPAAFV
jgi:light-regulated signal transduction histidine kinase (bacteriophytochrome)